MSNKKREILIIGIVLIIQTIIFIIAGVNKVYIHMDEAYSLGLASYDKVEIQDSEDFYNNWHNKEYYEDYLTVNDDEIGEYSQVYENQKNDVHPPIYYLLLRIAMGFNINSFSKWPGIIINIIIYIFITILIYLILQKLFEGKKWCKEKSIILALISSITMASLTTVIYIRMYALSALNILITAFLHIKLYDSKQLKPKLLVLIGIFALIGSLTHYYYLFYLAMLYLMFAIKYLKEKKYRELIFYTLTMACAGILSLLIFPYSIQHMFFGYRGQGVISKLTDIPNFLISIIQYLWKINVFTFNNLMIVILVALIALIINKLIKKQKIIENKNLYAKYILFPTLFYFALVAVASPWIELRYVMPVCTPIFIITIYYLSELLYDIFKEKVSNIIMIVFLLALLISPIIFKIEPEVTYSNKKEIVTKLKGELNLPTIYCFNSGHNRFLDDILLFSILDESYIARDMEYTEQNIKTVFANKDISKGIIVFINPGQENDEILAKLRNATRLKEWTYLERLNACDVYYLK